MVVCYHYLPKSLISNFGWTGVDLFFVLSGYLISSRLIPYFDDSNLLKKFYRNRLLRIVPLYFIFLIFFLSGWFIFNSKETLIQFPFYTTHWYQFFLFIQNWEFIQHINENKTHLQHLWSIAVEEQIYIIFPLILLANKRNLKRFFVIIFLIFLFVLTSRTLYCFTRINNNYEIIFWNTFFRFDSFLAGVMIYLIFKAGVKINNAPSIIKWSGIISALILFIHIALSLDTEKNNDFIASVGYTLIAVTYAYVLSLVINKKNKSLNSFLLNNFLNHLGKISFGVYIFHWPIYILGFAILNKFNQNINLNLSNDAKMNINILCSCLLTYLLSYVSYKYYETFFLKWKEKYN